MRPTLPNILFALLLGAIAAPIIVCAEEPKTPPEKKDDKTPPKKDPAPAADAKDDKKADADPFTFPEDADANGLVAYARSLFPLRRGIKTREELIAFQAKLMPAIKKAAEKIIVLEKSDTTENGRFARRNLLSIESAMLGKGTDAEVDEFLGRLKKFAEAKLERDDVGMLSSIIQGVEFTKPEKAGPFITDLAKIFATSKDAAIVDYAKKLEGTARRLNLTGNTMELKGPKLDGKEFDLASLKGKVVLVDFWATWCGPCRAELPNLKKNYEGYHNKGFEVVGISGDQDRAALDKFLAEDKLPWITIHGEGGHIAAMDTYGISAFPTTLLVGKDGKVVALNARGPKLGELLKQQLGEPEAPKAPAADVAPEKKAEPEVKK